MTSVIYACSGHGIIKPYSTVNITYSDLFVNRDLICDMRDINYDEYDIILISPPCNYWSRANYRRDSSYYSLITKDLLPYAIDLLNTIDRPVIVENVRSPRLFSKYFGDKLDNVFIKTINKHTFFSNVNFGCFDFMLDYNNYPKSTNHNHKSTKQRQGDYIVQDVFSCFVDYCNFCYFLESKNE